MPENHEAADEIAQARVERIEARTGFHDELEDLMHQVNVEAEQGPATSLSADTAAWAIEQFGDLEPHEAMLTACQTLQQDEQQFDASYKISNDDPEFLRVDIEALMNQQVAIVRNTISTGQVRDGVPAQVPVEVGEEAAGLVIERKLSDQQAVLRSANIAQQTDVINEAEVANSKEVKADELETLQVAFNQLRADGVGIADALRQVIASANHPETQQHLNAILSKVILLQTALPNKPDVVNRLLNTTGLNLAAATVTGSFADFMDAAQTDDALTDADRKVLRQVLKQGDRHLRTGSQVRDAAIATTIDPTTGNAVPLNTVENKAEVRPGVFAYTQTGKDVILEIREGGTQQTVDVTGLDGQSIGLVVEIMGLSALAATSGAKGYMKHVYGVDFGALTAQKFDPITLNVLRQKLTHLLGSGHDGEIKQLEQKRQLLLTQMRLVSPNGSLQSWEDDPDGYRKGVEELGLYNDAVLEAFGEYTQLHASDGKISRDAVQRHLSTQFPALVSVRRETSH